ncbi:hypothetical protein [Chryseobacterium sp. CT-SW4]|uniref:hypothetical protein n=1 Tax=Chryseobacterium sp. SW-1 TaxID=3157343 RepID=UPI003B0236A5
MKKNFLLLTLFLVTGVNAQVGINTGTPDNSANLHVSNDATAIRGTLLNPVTTAQRNSITSPATGLIVYDTNVKCLMTNNGTPAVPNWQCVGAAGNSGTPIEYTKHFHYALPNTIPVSQSDFNGRSGTVNTTTQTLLSNWLATNDPGQVAELPMVDGIRMDIVFQTKGGPNGTLYRPLIVNTNPSTPHNLVGVTRADISGLYQWQESTYLPANGYVNVDADLSLGWGSQGFLEVSVSTFRILGDDGDLYRATFYGYYPSSTTSGDKNHIHLVLEKFGAQPGGVHN